MVSLAFLPAFGPPKMGRKVRCAAQLHQIGLSISLYAEEHSGKIPQTFDDLRPYASDLNKLLICPAAKDTSGPSYQILASGQKWSSLETTNTIIVTEPISNHGTGRNALYGDGHIMWLSS
jgi:prepilin-type processing-associated H-X9-DG protein